MKKINRAICASIGMLTAAAVVSPAVEAAGYTQTKYPIVLVHGISGFDKLGGVVNYFYTIPYNLSRDGAKVYTAKVSAFSDSETRGRELATLIEPWARDNGGKVNIMAHSQGAPTARVALTLKPNRIASITSIDGVNKGSKFADMVRGKIPAGSWIEGGAAALANAFGAIIDFLSGGGHRQDAIASLETLTTVKTQELNRVHGWGVNSGSYCGSTPEDVSVAGNNVKMYSWTGTSRITNILDPLDGFLGVTSLAFGSEPNDGLVAKCATYMGRVIGDNYDMNHADAINHVLGVRSLWFNPVSLYREQANRLRNAGV